MLPISGWKGTWGKDWRISRSISKRGDSAISKPTMPAGWKRAIWRQRSEPTDAGVTGSIDESPFLRAGVRQPGEFERQSHRQPGSRRHPETEQEIQEIDGARKPVGGEP